MWTARDYLCHHGIKGQKWGVRRFQNSDGSLTSEGRIRYGSLKSEGQAIYGANKKNNDTRPLRSDGASEKLSKAIRSDKALTAIDKDYWAPLFSEDRTKGTANHQNAMEAADLGLKALDKIGWRDLPKDGKITGDDRVWFLYEDQTIGLPTAAHLINKGHSAKNIKKYYDTVDKNFDYYKDYERYFDVRESGGSEFISEFVDACESIKKQKSK